MFIRHLTHATSRQGCENVVLSLDPEGASSEDGPDYRLVHTKEDFNLASTGVSISSFKVFSELSKSADIVHYHFPWPFMDVVHFATRVKKPAVVTYHSDVVRQKVLKCLYTPLQNAFLNSMDAIVATSPNYIKSSPVLAKYPEKISMIPIGLEENMYLPAQPERVAELRARWGRFFLFVGVLRYYKGLEFLLKAVEGQGWPLLIVGAGPLEQELMKMAAERNLHNVHFIGQVTEQEKINLLTACYAVAFPSHLRSEAFGISLLEAAMVGKPMVCSEIGTGTSFVNQHEVSGLVVPPADPLAMRRALARLWDSPELATRFGRAARERYLEVFTSSGMGSAYVQLYSDLVKR